MKKYGVILTQNYVPIKMLRFSTAKEAEVSYQKYKRMGYGVVKVNIEKAHELFIQTV
jgi:hypothetical protein